MRTRFLLLLLAVAGAVALGTVWLSAAPSPAVPAPAAPAPTTTSTNVTARRVRKVLDAAFGAKSVHMRSTDGNTRTTLLDVDSRPEAIARAFAAAPVAEGVRVTVDSIDAHGVHAHVAD